MNTVWHNDVENDKQHFISSLKTCGNWHAMHTIPHGSDIPAHSTSASGDARCVIWQKSHLFMMLVLKDRHALFHFHRYTEIPCGFRETRRAYVTAQRKMIDGGCKSQHSLVLIKWTLLAFLFPFRSEEKSWFSVLFPALYMKLLPVTFNAHWLRQQRGPWTESDYLSLKAIQWMWRFCVVRVTVSELITDEL